MKHLLLLAFFVGFAACLDILYDDFFPEHRRTIIGPEPWTLKPGQALTLSCRSRLSEPSVWIVETKEGVPQQISANEVFHQGYILNNITIPSLSYSDNGTTFRCEARNHSNLTSYDTYVLLMGRRPLITTLRVVRESIITLTCTTSAVPRANISFSVNGMSTDCSPWRPCDFSVYDSFGDEEITKTTKSLKILRYDPNSKFTCTAKNNYGKVQLSTWLDGKPPIGGKCETEMDCRAPLAQCVYGLCKCPYGYVNVFDPQERCIKSKTVGDRCDYGIECSIPFSDCDNRFCVCRPGFAFNGTACKHEPLIGDSCNDDAECMESIDFSYCGLSYAGSQCQCELGRRYSHGRCIIDDFTITMKVVLIGSFTGLSVIVLAILFVTIKSSRLVFMQRKRNQYRRTLVQQPLSIGDMFGKTKATNENVVVNREAVKEVRVTGIRVPNESSSESPRIGISENIPLVNETHDC